MGGLHVDDGGCWLVIAASGLEQGLSMTFGTAQVSAPGWRDVRTDRSQLTDTQSNGEGGERRDRSGEEPFQAEGAATEPWRL